jgi:hypothetical protein
MNNPFRSNYPAIREKQFQAWEKRRKRGKLHFVLTFGSLGWGGFMFVAMTCSDVFIRHHKLVWPVVIVGLFFWLIAGYGWGLYMWRRFEERFHGPTNSPPSIFSR